MKEAKEKAGSTDNWNQSFTYDRYGNRLTHGKEINGSSVTHNSQSHPSISNTTNRITSAGYDYDKNGNLILDADGRSFTFDDNNKQILITSGNVTVGQCLYDGDGKRIKKFFIDCETFWVLYRKYIT